MQVNANYKGQGKAEVTFTECQLKAKHWWTFCIRIIKLSENPAMWILFSSI